MLAMVQEGYWDAKWWSKWTESHVGAESTYFLTKQSWFFRRRNLKRKRGTICSGSSACRDCSSSLGKIRSSQVGLLSMNVCIPALAKTHHANPWKSCQEPYQTAGSTAKLGEANALVGLSLWTNEQNDASTLLNASLSNRILVGPNRKLESIKSTTIAHLDKHNLSKHKTIPWTKSSNVKEERLNIKNN